MKKNFEQPKITVNSLASEAVMLELGGIGIQWGITESSNYAMIED